MGGPKNLSQLLVRRSVLEFGWSFSLKSLSQSLLPPKECLPYGAVAFRVESSGKSAELDQDRSEEVIKQRIQKSRYSNLPI